MNRHARKQRGNPFALGDERRRPGALVVDDLDRPVIGPDSSPQSSADPVRHRPPSIPRTIAAVNVLNAAFMTAATITVAVMQKFGATLPALFLLIGATTLLVALAIWKTMPEAG